MFVNFPPSVLKLQLQHLTTEVVYYSPPLPTEKTGKRTAAKVTWINKVAIAKYKSSVCYICNCLQFAIMIIK